MHGAKYGIDMRETGSSATYVTITLRNQTCAGAIMDSSSSMTATGLRIEGSPRLAGILAGLNPNGEGPDEESRAPMSALDPAIAQRLKRDANGLFSAVVQERGSGVVLMVAWMDDDALARTLATREATYFSRSRNEQWIKGATSGHTQYVHSVRLDCDGDTVLLEVDQVGGACHTGDHSCFDADQLLGPAQS